MTPLDEGMIMDMPISAPWASVAQAADDVKERDMVLCRFPEVDMVVGKAGRAETSTDPAPLDMIETMVNFRPQELWPRRKLRAADAERLTRLVLDALSQAGVFMDRYTAYPMAMMPQGWQMGVCGNPPSWPFYPGGMDTAATFPNLPLPQMAPSMTACDPTLVQSFYVSGIMVGLGDGSVRLVSSGISQYSWNLALNPSDGQTFDSSW